MKKLKKVGDSFIHSTIAAFKKETTFSVSVLFYIHNYIELKPKERLFLANIQRRLIFIINILVLHLIALCSFNGI